MEIAQIRADIEALEPKFREMPHHLSVYREVVQAARTWLLLVNRMNLPEDVERLITVGQRIIVILNQMYRAGMLLFSGTPWGFATGMAFMAMSQLYVMEGY